MAWYKIAQTSAEKVSFLMLDLSYYPAILELEKKTGFSENFASYIDMKKNIVSEFMNDEDMNKKAIFGFKFFTNSKKFIQYRIDASDSIKETNQYKKRINKINLGYISQQETIDLFEKGRAIYQKALGLYLLSQPEYTSNIEKKIRAKLGNFVPEKSTDEVLGVLVSSADKSCLEKERFDWLADVALPILVKYKKFRETKEVPDVCEKIKKHIEKYKYYSASIEFGLWDEKHYWKILKNDYARGYENNWKEFLDIKNKKRLVLGSRAKVIRKYGIGKDILEISEIISELGLLRINMRILGWQFFNYFFALLINASANRRGVSKKLLNDLSRDEYLRFLKKNADLPERKSRKNSSIFIIIKPKSGYEIFYNKQADEKFNFEIDDQKTQTKELRGAVVYGKGKVKGRAFIFIWGSKDFDQRIYNFPGNAILVAGQTRPLLMPAIRKAKAIITDEGGLLCHAAIVARELRIPCVVGTKIATKIFKTGDIIELDLKKGVVRILERKK